MRKATILFFSYKFLIFFLFSFSLISINSATVHEINEDVSSNPNYKKAEFESDAKTLNHYFKYSVTSVPKSRVTAFRIDFDSFNELSLEMNKVFCTFVDESTSDEKLIEELGLLTEDTSACVGKFNEKGIFDGIIKHDSSKTKLGIYLFTRGVIQFTARVFLRTTEKFLSVSEGRVTEDENYSLVPFTVTISDFREYASRILFYSYTRELQMYYVETDSPYPEKLFSGNVLSVYTNPNMVRQKYHNANTMILLTREFSQDDKVAELFKFQVKFFPSNYLLDYYVSNNPNGRSKNSPLAINMTECENPYYVILNYNQPEKQTSLYIDQIYGSIKSLSVAPTFNSITWEEMIEDDMESIQISTRKHVLPSNSPTHMDVYKVECDIPLLLNFYFVDETADIPNLDFGHVAITTLKSYRSVSLPFNSGIIAPELTIEIFNPIKLPLVIVDDGQNEMLINTNKLIKTMPFTTTNPIVVKERGGDSNTRVIVKVGYSTRGWQVTDNIKYSPSLNMYVYTFPNDQQRLNYTYVNLITSGTTTGDNVKYCVGTNIGSAILPSNENCYRVSKDNSYTLKVLNPLVMHKDYELEEDAGYYVSLKPVNLNEQITISAVLTSYNTNERNLEGVGNMVTIEMEEAKTILTAPKDKDVQEFVQIQQCDNSEIKMEILNAYDNSKIVVPETTIPAGKKNFYNIFNNIFLETEVQITGNSGTKVFIKHAGVRNAYYPSLKDSPKVNFNPELNQLLVDSPINNYERVKYIVLIGKEGELSAKGITLCDFAERNRDTSLASYNKTVESYSDITSITINFNKVGLSAGQKFEALVFCEQEINSQMAFLYDIFTGIVGDVKVDSVTEIKTPVSTDADYVYATGTAKPDDLIYYYSYLPTSTFDVPVGALRIELDTSAVNGFSKVDCAFVEDGEDALSMIEAVEDVIDSNNPYCIGGRSTTNEKIYNYIFRYEYTKDKKPKRLVIKISNGLYADGPFNVYVRKGENTYLENTDFEEQREYGRQEEYKKSVMPYIVDLEKIRGEGDNYVSKLLIYSQHLEMQMYYIDETGQNNAPILLFTGNIMLVYTKIALAEQKYHSSKLILLSENLNGQEHSSVGNNFRFHTKMYKSDAQIEYFVSNNPTGRTLNYPLSLEMNTCSSTNNKYYYILNYNRQEDEKILYLDMIFGSMKIARIANEINAEKWDSLIQNSMVEIKDYQITLTSKSQHIDIVEIECNTPLLANVYYNSQGQVYSGLERGDIAVKLLEAHQSISLSVDTSMTGVFYYSVSCFNSKENPDMTIRFDTSRVHQINENSLSTGFLFYTPPSISIINNGDTATRFIFKLGYGVESEWIDEDEKDIKGTLYSKDNKFVYKFPFGDNKRNYTNVTINVLPMRKGSEEMSENIKFCYSTSIGMAIDTSMENCFRTGANIPYSLTFINPLIAPKLYKSYSDNYYVTLSPFTSSDYISLEVYENKYETTERNIEGVPNIVNIADQDREESTILSIPEIISDTRILVQMQACVSASTNALSYTFLNAYSQELIAKGNINRDAKFFTYSLTNNLMETELKFNGYVGDSLFVKHIGLTDYQINLRNYYATFDSTQNSVSIIKPIYDEAFRVTVLVGATGELNSISLCSFVGKTEEQYSQLAKYAKTFPAVSSNLITHYVDFRSFGFKEGDKFDLLVYAVQVNNAKLEILYNVISGEVGKIQGITEITGTIPGKSDYVTQVFVQNTTSNYMFYNFQRKPIGEVASLKIITPEGEEEGMRVNKVGCTFVKKEATDEDMVSAVNKAIADGKSVCVGETQKDTNGFDALINAKDFQNGYSKLVIQVIYGLGEENKLKKDLKAEGVSLNITLRINGFKVDTPDMGYNEEEVLTLVPYVLDLQEIRGDSPDNYVSKVMLFSNTREMQMFYLDPTGAPVELFSGNIMLVYTNPEVVREKYHNAQTMILVTDSLSRTQRSFIGEKFRFKASYYDSATTIQYYVSANPTGRLLNNPTSIEMLSCDQPYYYILNYHFTEGDRILHLDNIFGEVNTTKIANQLTDDNWADFVKNMQEFKGSEYYIQEQTKYHMDVIEVTCKTPLLLNVYYTDPIAPKKTNLDQGDISIISLYPGTSETLTFKLGLDGEFIYSFNILNEESKNPNILVKFEDDDEMECKQNGIFRKRTKENYYLITIYNRQVTGSELTKVIFKFGYVVEGYFAKIANDMYNLQKENRTANLFAYKFRTGDDRLNYTKATFTVSTFEDNVKFCYASNLGAFIDPSLQNCFRVGRSNPYDISVLNPFVMYKDYYTDEEVMDYYVSFRTEDIAQNITIVPKLTSYKTLNRNTEGFGKSISVTNGQSSTILTTPAGDKQFLFVQIHVCTPDENLNYEFNNAYYDTSLGETGYIQANTKNNFRNIANTKLDTELVLKTLGNSKVFVKHTGINTKYQPVVEDLKVTFDAENYLLNFNQPIEGEEFKYTVYLDKRGALVNQAYTLCSVAENTKLAHFSGSVTSNEGSVNFPLDFSAPELVDYKSFDVLVLAEQVNNGKLMILSNILSHTIISEESSNLALIIILVILAVLLVVGGIFIFICLRNIKNKPMEKAIIAKPTNLDDIQATNKGEKMLDSMAQSQAV